MAFLEALPAIAEAAGPMIGRLMGSGVGQKVMQTVGTKAVSGAESGMGKNIAQGAAHLANTAADNFHPISNSGPTPASQPMAQPGYNNLSQAQFADSVQQQ